MGRRGVETANALVNRDVKLARSVLAVIDGESDDDFLEFASALGTLLTTYALGSRAGAGPMAQGTLAEKLEQTRIEIADREAKEPSLDDREFELLLELRDLLPDLAALRGDE